MQIGDSEERISGVSRKEKEMIPWQEGKTRVASKHHLNGFYGQ